MQSGRAVCAAAGLPEEWGTCPECHGEGDIWADEESKRASDEWARSEPPTGPGYQIWETVSEGSPISPVFATPEELARHNEEAGTVAGRLYALSTLGSILGTFLTGYVLISLRSVRIIVLMVAAVLMLTGATLYAGPLSQLVGNRGTVRFVHVYTGVLLPVDGGRCAF